MAFKNELRRLRKQLGLTQAELSARLGIAKSTISMYECGKREPDFEMLNTIAGFFNVDMNCLTGIFSPQDATIASITSAEPISAQEYNFIHSYRIASPADRQIIENIVARYPAEEIRTVPPAKNIPLFGTAAAAGPGELDTGLPWEDYSVPADSSATFAVRISGDSMEPVLSDGQIALCVEKTPQVGDIVVMMVNGSLLVKQFIVDSFGNVYLRSINRKRNNLDLDIKASGNDTVNCFGIVILPKRPSLVLN